MNIKVKEVVVKERLRKADPAKVQELADSIKLLGLLQPIILNNRNELVAGLHRLEAHKLLGLDEIKYECLMENDALREELAELDENLVRADFHYIDRGMYLMRKKEIYDTLNNTKTAKDEGLKVKPFTEFVAEKTNQSKRTIQNEIKVAKDVIPELKEELKAKDIGFVKAIELSRLEPEAQKKAVEQLRDDKPAAISINLEAAAAPGPTSNGGAAKKTAAEDLVSHFEAFKMKVTTVYPKLSADERERIKELLKETIRALN